jgi:glycosyltransferase involved in cell wall biosynthesis
VSSSYSEAFPNVVAEAMACGTVCVATDVGESGAIVRDTGAVVPPRDPQALAAAVLEHLKLSPADLRSRGDAARSRIVREFSLDRVGARYRDLYESLTPAPRIHHEASACAE